MKELIVSRIIVNFITDFYNFFCVSNIVDNITLVKTNAEIRNHEVEIIGEKLRSAMDGMKSL